MASSMQWPFKQDVMVLMTNFLKLILSMLCSEGEKDKSLFRVKTKGKENVLSYKMVHFWLSWEIKLSDGPVMHDVIKWKTFIILITHYLAGAIANRDNV